MSKDKFNEILRDLATKKQRVMTLNNEVEEKKKNEMLSLDPKHPMYPGLKSDIDKLKKEISEKEEMIKSDTEKIKSELENAKNSKIQKLKKRAKTLVEAAKVEEDKVKDQVNALEKEQEDLQNQRSQKAKEIAALEKEISDPKIDDTTKKTKEAELKKIKDEKYEVFRKHENNELILTFLKMNKQEMLREYNSIDAEIKKVNGLSYENFDKELKEKDEQEQTQTQTQTQTGQQPQYQQAPYYGQPVYYGQQPVQQGVQPNVQTQQQPQQQAQNRTEAKEPIAPKPDPTKHQEPPKRDKNQKVEVKLNDDGTITYKYGDINATYNLKDYKASKADVIARAKRNFGNEGKEIAEERIEPLLMKFILEKVKDGQLYNSLLKKYMDGEDLDKKFAQYDMTNVKPATFLLSDDKWAEVAEKAADSGFEVKGYVSKKQLEKQKKEAKERKEAKKEAKKENELPKGYTYKDFCEKCKNGKNPLGEKWDKFFEKMVDKGFINKTEVEQEKEKIYNSLLQEVRKQMKDTKTVDINALSRNAEKWSDKEIKLPDGQNAKFDDAFVLYMFREYSTASKVFEYIKETLPKKEQTQIDVDRIKHLEELRKEEAEAKKKTRDDEWKNGNKVDNEKIPDELEFSKFYTKHDNGEKPLGEKWKNLYENYKSANKGIVLENTYNELMKCVLNKMKDNTRPISTQAIYDVVKSQMGDFKAKYTNADGKEVYFEEELLNSVLDDKDGLKKMLEYAKTGLSKEEQEKVDIDEIKTISEEKEKEEEEKKKEAEKERTNAG